ncbi:MAG: helix-turn-helix domain-containing protein [Actinobacteria bacterium]|nr:helix-turn-helix domain-containing protein [Actinomycetota bacterium]
MIVYKVEDSKDAYSVQTFADRFEVSEETVYRLIRAGQIRAFRVGRQLRIPVEELARIRSHSA